MTLTHRSAWFGFGALCVSLLSVTHFAYWPENEVAIGSECKPQGALSRLQAQAQGDRFWIGQIESIDANERVRKRQAGAIAAANANLEKVSERTEKTMEDLYTKHPALRPKPASVAATALRDRADEIGNAELQESIDKLLAERAAALSACRVKIAEAMKR